MKSIKRRSLFAFLTLLGASACTHQNEGSILVLEGDEKKTCSELHAEYGDADRLSEENMDARRRWILQLSVMEIAACQNRQTQNSISI